MKNVTKFVPSLFIAFFVLSVHAQDTTINTPGAYIHSGADGVQIQAPGVNIYTPPAAAYGNAPAPSGPAADPAPPIAVSAPPATTASYANASLSGMDFSHQNLAGVSFANATLQAANFSGANLSGANFANATLTGANFSGANLQNAQLPNATLDGANLMNADFSHANLTNASLNQALVTGAIFAGAILTNVDMSRTLRQPAAAAPAPVIVNAAQIATALQTEKKIDLTVNFDFNSDKLTPDGASQVQAIAAALKNPALANARIMVEGHTDNVGSDKYNMDLSNRRAMRVASTLSGQYGVPAAKLSAQGFGKTRPIASNDSDIGRAKNRRVTIVNLGV